MQTRTRYGLLLMLVTVLLFMFASKVHCQENRKHLPEHPVHDSVGDFYDKLRILRIKVIDYNPASGVISAKFEDERRVDYMQYQVTTTTVIKAPIKGEMMIIYCKDKHGTGPNERNKYLLQAERSEN